MARSYLILFLLLFIVSECHAQSNRRTKKRSLDPFVDIKIETERILLDARNQISQARERQRKFREKIQKFDPARKKSYKRRNNKKSAYRL